MRDAISCPTLRKFIAEVVCAIMKVKIGNNDDEIYMCRLLKLNWKQPYQLD